MKSLAFILLAAITAVQPVRAAAPADIEFNRDVRPILSDKCFACHGPDEKHRKAKLRLDVMDNRKDEAVIVPGKPGDSDFAGAYRSVDLLTTAWVRAVKRAMKELGA